MKNNIELFLVYLEKNKNKSSSTIRNYSRALGKFIKYLNKIGKNFDDINLMILEAYVGPALHKEGQGLAGRSMAISAIKGFYAFCMKRGLIVNNHARELEHPLRGQSLPGMLPLQYLERLMFAPDLSTIEGLRDAAIISFLGGTGCRVSGLTSLNESQLSRGGEEKPQRLYVSLEEKGKKTRKIPLNRKVELFLFA